MRKAEVCSKRGGQTSALRLGILPLSKNENFDFIHFTVKPTMHIMIGLGGVLTAVNAYSDWAGRGVDRGQYLF